MTVDALFTLLVPVFPFVGFLIIGLCRKQLPKSVISVIGCGVILISFLLSLYLFNEAKKGMMLVNFFDLISAGKLLIPFGFQIDPLSALFLLIITGVGFLIHVFSSSYMHEETPEHYGRFFAYLNLFVFFMLLLVMGSNYVMMFIGWEGVGLCSYLLIGYWFKNTEYNNAAKKAFIMNRIGDLGFLIAIFWLIAKAGTVSYHTADAGGVFESVLGKLTKTDITGITLLLFVGAVGKSAQIPLYTWLPDAMAGPTPVSALIHAATMVTAGIYMVARSNKLFSMADTTQHVIAVIGLATALFAGTIALKQNDIKKVLAYSTVSQLGYMFLGLGVGAYTGAVFHVMTHAFFKALLFLGAGSVIHAMHHEQDIRHMGGLKKYLPVTHITFLIGCIAISGIPPFAGFFSKDEILAAAYEKNPVYYYLGVAGAMLTAFYMFRLYATTFLGKFRGTHEQEHHLHESPAAMTFPLIILALLSIGGGFLGIPEVFAPNAHWLQHFLEPVIAKGHAAEGALDHNTEYMLMGLSVGLAFIAIIIALVRFSKKPELGEPTGLGKVLANKWYVDELYNAIIVKPIQGLARFLNSFVERDLIDWIVNGVGRLVNYGSRQIRLLQSGLVGNYVLLMVLSMLVLIVVQFFLKGK
jgi:NADH-quinone oxidoreductase subunit L